jgi:DNA-binding IclR family transcriptional regulator
MWDTREDVKALNTFEKCVRILTLFSEASPTLQVAEIAERLHLPRSTAYRYVAALRKHRFLEPVPDGEGVRLGNRILELAATMSRKPLRDVAFSYMERIARETGETIMLCGLREHLGVCLAKVDGTHALRVSYELGDAYPLHTAATGKAILAFLDPDEQKAIVDDVGLPRFTDSTITQLSALRENLARVRKLGHAESEGEAIEGTRGIAAPIFSPSGRVTASIGVSVPTHRAQGENRRHLIRLLVEAAARITEEWNA